MNKSTFINQMAIGIIGCATENDGDATLYWEDMDVQKRIGHLASVYGKGVSKVIEDNGLDENQAELVYMIYHDEFYFNWKLIKDKSDDELMEEIDDFITNCVLFRIREMNIEY